MFLADAVVETHDRIVGRTYREAARTCEAQLGDETAAVRGALRAFAELGRAPISAQDTGEALDAVIADSPGWGGASETLSPGRPRSRPRLCRIAGGSIEDSVLSASTGRKPPCRTGPLT